MALPPATHSSGCCQGFEAQLPPPKAVQPCQPRRWDQAPLVQCFIDLLPGVKVGLSTHRTQHPSPPLPDSPAAPLNAGLRFPTIICAALMASHLITETHALSCSYLDTNSTPQLMLFSLPWFSTVMLFGPHCRMSLTQPPRVRSHFSPSRPLQSHVQDSGLCPNCPCQTAAQLLRKQPCRGDPPAWSTAAPIRHPPSSQDQPQPEGTKPAAKQERGTRAQTSPPPA